MIQRRVDEETGVIHVTVLGEWTAASIDEHFSSLRQTLDARRKLGQPIRVLIDVRAMSHPSPELQAHLRTEIERTYSSEDRVVLVTPDAEMKESVRRFLVRGGVWSFCSELAAEQWLTLGDSHSDMSC